MQGGLDLSRAHGPPLGALSGPLVHGPAHGAGRCGEGARLPGPDCPAAHQPPGERSFCMHGRQCASNDVGTMVGKEHASLGLTAFLRIYSPKLPLRLTFRDLA